VLGLQDESFVVGDKGSVSGEASSRAIAAATLVARRVDGLGGGRDICRGAKTVMVGCAVCGRSSRRRCRSGTRSVDSALERVERMPVPLPRVLCAASAAARATTASLNAWASRYGRPIATVSRVRAHPFAGGAEDVGEIRAHLSLVGDPREAARSRKHAEQRQLGKITVEERSST